jgi:hypothetical protein
MENHSERITAILSEADSKLLQLIAGWANAGDLRGVDAARTAALQVRAIIETLRGRGRRLTAKAANAATSSRDKLRKQGAVRKAAANPEFEVRNSTLYRIGWSKKKKDTYLHKVPRTTVFDIVDAMTSLARTGPGPFTAEEIVARTNEDSSVSIPSYQGYVVIGFLRARALIEQVGRAGYQIPADLEAKVQTLWKSLDPEQS